MPHRDEISNDFIPIDHEPKTSFKPTKDSTPKQKRKSPGAFAKNAEADYNLVIGEHVKIGTEAKHDPLDGTLTEMTKRKQFGGKVPKINFTLPYDEISGSKG